MTLQTGLQRLLLVSLTTVTAAAADDAATGHGWMTGRVAEYNELRSRIPAPELAQRLVDEALDLDLFANRVLQDYVGEALIDFAEHLDTDEYGKLVSIARERVVQALRQRLIDDLTGNLGSLGALSVSEAKFDDRRGTVVLQDESTGKPAMEIRLHRREDGTWRVEDLTIVDQPLSRRYRNKYRETMDEHYSPAVLQSQLRQLDYVVLEDFSASEDGKLPLGWRWRDRDEGHHKPYEVRSINKKTYLAAHDSSGSVLLLRFSHWDPRQYPIMTWCWRANSLPAGGDERFGHTNDSAAGIYVFFSQTWIGMPRHIKYVWSTTLSQGTTGRRERIARPYFVVVESGDQRVGKWLQATVDLEENYGATWGGRPKNHTQGLGLLTDVNSTESLAAADYADLRVWTREAFEAGRIEDYCTCYQDPELMSEDHAKSATIGGPTGSEMTP